MSTRQCLWYQARKLSSTKTATFAETTLKQLAIISNRQEEGNTFILSQEDLSTLFTISAAQIHFLKAEYDSLVVKNTFDEETSRLCRSFENHSSGFNLQSLQNLPVAADLASSRSNQTRGGARGRSSNQAYSYRSRPNFRGQGFSTDWQRSGRFPIARNPDQDT